MRFIVLVTVLGVGSSFAFAGPSDHAGRTPGDPARAGHSEMRKVDRPVRAPYALTGQRTQHRVVEYRDIPRGRGQTERAAFWKYVTE